MHYFVLLIAYILGCATVVILFHRNILYDFTFLKSFHRNSNGVIRRLWYEFYARLSDRVDLSVYENGIELVELERKRIGMDAHDELAAHLSSLSVDLQLILGEGSALSPHTEKVLMEMRGKIKHTIEAFRRIIHGLLPVTLEMGNLEEAVAELCRKKDNTKGTSVLFRSIGEQVKLNDVHKLYVYRIIQELLNNSLKHSQCWHIFVTLEWTQTHLEVTVRDNGNGLPKSKKKTNAYGLEGIFIRSQVIGAAARINSSSGGLVFDMLLPLKNSVGSQAEKTLDEFMLFTN